MTNTTFDRATVKLVRAAIEAALKSVEDEFNISVELGSSSYARDGSNCTYKVQCAAKTADGKSLSPERKDFVVYAPLSGIPADSLDKEFRTGGKTFRITGWRRRAPKRPVLAESLGSGKAYVFPATTVASALSAEQANLAR